MKNWVSIVHAPYAYSIDGLYRAKMVSLRIFWTLVLIAYLGVSITKLQVNYHCVCNNSMFIVKTRPRSATDLFSSFLNLRAVYISNAFIQFIILCGSIRIQCLKFVIINHRELVFLYCLLWLEQNSIK